MFRTHGRHLLTGTSAVLFLTLAPAGVATASSGSGGLPCPPIVPFHAGDFEHPTRIDNEYLPMLSGTRLTYEGVASSGGGSAKEHQVVFTVTDLTKVVDGVPTRVIYDLDLSAGEVAEAELAFFAQDRTGNVWNLGEYPEEFENGSFA